MNKSINHFLLALSVLGLTACGGQSDSGAKSSENTKTAEAPASTQTCDLVSTKDGSPLKIKVAATDTPEAKEFLKTCVNPYTKRIAASFEEFKTLKEAGDKKFKETEYYKAKREYGFNNCTGCHGGKLEGVMAPSLNKGGGQGAFDTKWVYAKNSTDKGMFETISGGTPGKSGGTMFVWHKQLEGHTGDGLTTDQILRVISYIRLNYQGDGNKDWES